MIRRSLIAAAVLAATSTFAPLAAQAQSVLKAADVHPAGYPNVVAIESLGKKLSVDNEVVFAGQTPIKSLGAIDQHSQIQLYTEGPNDKLIQLIAVESYRDAVAIPTPPASVPELSYFEGGELGQLLDRERLATAWALTKAERPNLTITVPTIDAAIVDLNLRNRMVFPLARVLRRRKVPLVFTTGYDRISIDPEFRDVQLWGKPLNITAMARELTSMIRRGIAPEGLAEPE